MADRNQPIIDLHVHLFPEPMFRAIWDYFENRDWPVHRQGAEEIAETLQAHGITHATGLSYPHKTGVARELNRFNAEVGERLPFFWPFACVHVDDADLRDCVDEAIRSDHLHGFKFQPLVQRFDVNDPRLDYLYERCLEADFPILAHLGTAPMKNDWVGFAHFRRLMERFPELRICVAHMGADECDEFVHMLDSHPRMYLDTAMINTRTDLFDTTWRGCFGSDWPNVPYQYQEALDSVERFPFPNETLPEIMHNNALRFLKKE